MTIKIIRKKTKERSLRRAGDMADWQRRQDLYRAYDGPIPSPTMARAGDGEVRLAGLIRDSEERASRHEDAAEKWLELGKPEMARRCREDAMLARNTAALNRDALDKLRAGRAGACPGRDVGACPGRDVGVCPGRDPGAGEGEAA